MAKRRSPRRGVLEFNGAEVRALIEHAVSCERFTITFEERAALYGEDKVFEPQTGEQHRGSPALTFVKDQGAYLMSNGRPGLADMGADVPGRKLTEREEKMTKSGEFRYKVAYAKGLAPHADDFSWYDRARALLGGDDFAVRIEIASVEAGLRASGGATLVVGVHDDHFEFGLPAAH